MSGREGPLLNFGSPLRIGRVSMLGMTCGVLLFPLLLLCWLVPLHLLGYPCLSSYVVVDPSPSMLLLRMLK